jgi:transposase
MCSVGVPLEGLPGCLRAADHDLQPLEPLERPRHLDAHLCGAGERRPRRCGNDRQFRGEGPAGVSRRQRGAAAQAIGRSRGGRTTKIHAICDGVGRLRAFRLSPGNIADITVALALLDIAPVGQTFLADKGYDATPFRNRVADRGARVVIPNNATRKRPYPFDPAAYRDRNAIERMFCRLKDWRRIATRYDRLAINFASGVALVAAVLWWVWLSLDPNAADLPRCCLRSWRPVCGGPLRAAGLLPCQR